MSYLTTEEFESILDTVTIFPVTSLELGDISQYSFDCRDAEEYVTFLRNKAVDLEKLAVIKTFVIIHNETRKRLESSLLMFSRMYDSSALAHPWNL